MIAAWGIGLLAVGWGFLLACVGPAALAGLPAFAVAGGLVLFVWSKVDAMADPDDGLQ